MLKKIYKIEAVLSIILGIFLILNSKNTILGAVIGINNIPSSSSLLFGSFFLIAGLLLFVITQIKKD